MKQDQAKPPDQKLHEEREFGESSGRDARQRTTPPPKPQKQKLPDEKPHGDRPGQGAGSVGRALRYLPAPKETKR